MKDVIEFIKTTFIGMVEVLKILAIAFPFLLLIIYGFSNYPIATFVVFGTVAFMPLAYCLGTEKKERKEREKI